jgi:hypothetical protein
MSPEVIVALATVGLLMIAALKFAYEIGRDVGRGQRGG